MPTGDTIAELMFQREVFAEYGSGYGPLVLKLLAMKLAASNRKGSGIDAASRVRSLVEADRVLRILTSVEASEHPKEALHLAIDTDTNAAAALQSLRGFPRDEGQAAPHSRSLK